MGILVKIIEKLELIYFWQTLDIKIPIEEAETAVKLYSKVLG